MLHHGRRNPNCGANSKYCGSGSRSILGDTEVKEMVPNPDEREPLEPKRSVPEFQRALSDLSNSELLSALDLTLLKLERRFYRYAHEGRRSWRWPMRSCCWHQGPGRDSSRPCQLPSIPGSSASGRSGRVESHQNQPLV